MAGKAWSQEVTGYDIGYRPTGTKLTVPAGEGALTGTYTTSTAYNLITGAQTSTDIPAAGGLPAEDLSTSHNINGLPVSIGSNTVDYVNYTNYNELGQVQRTTFGDDPKQVVATNILDPATGRLLSTALDKQDQTATSVNSTSYTYTPNGDVTSVTNIQGAARDTQCFSYDYQGRLTEAWTDTGTTTTKPGPSVPGIGGCTNTAPSNGEIGGTAPYWQSFTYDVTGNRKTLTDHDPAGDANKTSVTTNTYPAPGAARPHTPTSTTRRIGANTPVTTNLTYDKTGNTLTRPDTGDAPDTLPGDGGPIQTLTWNSEGKLASNTTNAGTSTYIYDAAGNRLARKDPGKTTLYTGSDELTRDTATDKVTGTRYYATPGGTTIVRTSAGKLSYVAADHHNTGTTSIDATTLTVQRRTTKPFGEDRGTKPTAWPGERGFVGGTQDKTTGLTHIGAREYDPAAGRFLSADPLMVLDDPRQHNAYQYANNSPLTNWDPTGLALDDGTGHGEKADGTSPANVLTPGASVNGEGYALYKKRTLRALAKTRFTHKPPTLKNFLGGMAHGAAGMADMLPTSPILSLLGIGPSQQLNWATEKLGLEFDENSSEFLIGELATPVPGGALAKAASSAAKEAGALRTIGGAEEMGSGNVWKTSEELSNATGKTTASRNRAIDAIISEDFPDLKLTHRPVYSYGVNSGMAKPNGGTQIGFKRFASRSLLRTTVVHEELHHRWFARGLTNHHPRDGSGTSDQFYGIVDRYKSIRGW